ncbi:glycosyltransferase [Patescibacteria group bacterium]|nr:MAG: glycosyltransferase [Patescibacteria group bacterium]
MLSIVIPTLDEEELLPRLLASIKRQSFRDLEVIVADAGSRDRTREIAMAHGATVVAGGLPSVGRNSGAAAAKGELLLFLDADVELPDPDFLTHFVAEFERQTLDVATTFIKPLSDRQIDAIFYGFYNSYIFATQKFFPHAHGFCILARRTIHELIGGFDPAVRLAEDHDYAQRAARRGRFGVVRGTRIPVSTRRFERDGHLLTACKYILCELHMLALGAVKSDIFRYRFGYSKSGAKSESKTISNF